MTYLWTQHKIILKYCSHFSITVAFALNSHLCATDKCSSWNSVEHGSGGMDRSGQAMRGVDPPLWRLLQQNDSLVPDVVFMPYSNIRMHASSRPPAVAKLPHYLRSYLTFDLPLLLLTGDWQVQTGDRLPQSRHRLTLSPVSVYFNNSNRISNNHHFSVPD